MKAALAVIFFLVGYILVKHSKKHGLGTAMIAVGGFFAFQAAGMIGQFSQTVGNTTSQIATQFFGG